MLTSLSIFYLIINQTSTVRRTFLFQRNKTSEVTSTNRNKVASTEKNQYLVCLANIKNNTFVVARVFPICFIWFLFCFTLFFPKTTFWRVYKDFWTKINSNTIVSYWVISALPGAYYMQRLAKLIWCPLPSLLDCIIWQTPILGDKENDMKKKTAFHIYWSL